MPRRESWPSVVALADRHRSLTTAQLLAAGLSEPAIRRACDDGLLTRLHVGSYLVANRAPTPDDRRRAAVAAIGGDAVLSHRSLAEARGLLAEVGGPIHVTTSRRGAARAKGIRVHHSALLTPADVRVVGGLRGTSIAWLLVDLAATVPRPLLERAVREALTRMVVAEDEIRTMLLRRAGARGVSRLRAALGDGRRIRTATRQERRFFDEWCAGGSPQPVPQHPIKTEIGTLHPDFVFRRERLVVESDGPPHETVEGRAEDARRDAALLDAGWRTVRYPNERVDDDVAGVASDVRSHL